MVWRGVTGLWPEEQASNEAAKKKKRKEEETRLRGRDSLEQIDRPAEERITRKGGAEGIKVGGLEAGINADVQSTYTKDI